MPFHHCLFRLQSSETCKNTLVSAKRYFNLKLLYIFFCINATVSTFPLRKLRHREAWLLQGNSAVFKLEITWCLEPQPSYPTLCIERGCTTVFMVAHVFFWPGMSLLKPWMNPHPRSPELLVSNSYDGVPFLMHDSTLRRTTNIKEVYPNDTAQNAALFSWDTLQELNAGTWFLKVSAVKDYHQLGVQETPAGNYLIARMLGEELLC